MNVKKQIRSYQQKCHREYLKNIGLPIDYTYIDGNPIRPVPPVQTVLNGLMIIGAYPSARFERRPSKKNPKMYRTIPIADNLQPFGYEQYFDGIAVRTLTSADGLHEYLFSKLGKVSFTTCWITDLVKVFLYKEEHVAACKDVDPKFTGIKTRDRFDEFAEKSITWIQEETKICKPKLIITFGEEVARVISGDKQSSTDALLSSKIRESKYLPGYKSIYLPHPDACRRSSKWLKRLDSSILSINQILI
jgi:hypothetical protein